MSEVLIAIIVFIGVFAAVYSLGMLYWGDREPSKYRSW